MLNTPDSSSTRQPWAPVELEAFLGGRGLQAVGLISLFLSAAFFFKLAVDHNWISPEIRVLIGLIAGAALLITGVVMHRRPAGNRAIVEGLLALGGALCYLSFWAAGPLFELVPSTVAFGGMSIVTGFLTIVAARHRSQLTALYGIIGGLLTPALLPQSGQPVVLAAYLLALCAGMLKLADDRRFALVPGVAFLGCLMYAPQFAIGGYGWTYVHNLVVSSLFFLEFGAALFIAARRSDAITTFDAILGALNIAAYIGILEIDLMGHQAILTVALLVLAASLAWVTTKMRAGSLVDSLYLVGAVAALSLSIPALFGDRLWDIGAAFTVEGLLLYVAGLYHQRSVLRIAGVLMVAVAVPVGVLEFGSHLGSTLVLGSTPPSFFERVGGFTVMVLSLFGISAFARTAKQSILGLESEADIADFAVTLANLVAVFGIANIAYALPGALYATPSQQQLLTSVGWTIYAAGTFAVALRRNSGLLRWTSLALFTLLAGKVMVIDLASIELIDRVGVCFGLGVVTLIVSAIYLRRLRHAPAQEADVLPQADVQ